MSKKKLTKKIWYSSDIDNTGQPIIPPLAKNPDDLDGLHEGELFLHNSDEQPNIWIRTSGGRIVPLFKGGGGTADSISWINITDKPAWLVDGIIDYSEIVGTPDLSLYAKKSYVDSTFVTLSGNEDVSGIKNFTNGIKLSGIEFKYDSDNNAVCLQKTDGTPINFYVTGGLSMYGQGNTSVKSIMDAIAANLDSNTLAIQNGLLTVVGGTGGVDESAVRTLIESYDYATKDFVREYVLQNATGGEFELSKQMVIDALGFTPYSAENPNGYITAASIPSALKNPYALTFGSKTYDGSVAKSITASDLGAALSSDLSKYLPLTGGTISGQSVNPLTINSTNPNEVASYIIFGHNYTNKAYIGFSSNGAFIQESVNNNYLMVKSDGAYYNTNKLWHSGNLTKLSQLTDDVVSGKYLPLSGGTVNGIIYLNHTLNQGSRISFKNNRTEESSSWAVNVMNVTDASSNVMMRFGIYGTAKVLDYIFLGHNTYSDNNLRIYTDKVTFGSNTIWHAGNFNPADYLPLSGGTISSSNQAPLSINSTSDNTRSFIIFKHNGVNKAYIGYTTANGAFIENPTSGNRLCILDNLLYNDKTVWHSGNDGSGSGLDADLLDGLQPSELNVGSATKLQTARKLWGNTYDGTADVTGKIIMPNNNSYAVNNTDGTNYSAMYMSPSNILQIGYGTAGKGYDTIINGNTVKLTYGTSRTNALFINSSGNVGIGTTNPSKLLHIGGTFGNDYVYANFSTYNPYLALKEGSNIWYVQGLSNYLYLGSTSSKSLIIDASGNVGVVITPEYRFHVEQKTDNTFASVFQTPKSKVYLAHSSGRGIYASVLSGVSTSYLLSLKFNQTTLGSGGTSAFYVRTDGNIGAGTESPSAKLHVVGNILATGGVTMQSQRSLKNVVDERGLSLAELSTIKPTRYTWKDKRDDRIHFGGIADDIEKVLPEVIYTTSDGTLTMDYGNAGFAIASSLIKPVVDHETKIRMLEVRVKELEEELKRYSA